MRRPLKLALFSFPLRPDPFARLNPVSTTGPGTDARHTQGKESANIPTSGASPTIRWDPTSMSRRVRSKFLGICHIRNAEELTSFRQRDPRISQARIIFALLGIVCFLCQRCALGGRLPCGLTFESHLSCPISNCPTPGVVCTAHNPLRCAS
jgi:hypothetical protein